MPPAPVEEAPSPAAEIIDEAAQEAEEPTPAQAKAGVYKKGHIKLHGLAISIENPIGSVRQGISGGKAWRTVMKHHYGYFPGYEGKDKDHIDVFVGPKPESEQVYIVDQVNPKTKALDEHKILLGWDDIASARDGYLSNYEKGWQGIGAITPIDIKFFKSWLNKGNKKKSFLSSPWGRNAAKQAALQESLPDRGRFDADLSPDLSERGARAVEPDRLPEIPIEMPPSQVLSGQPPAVKGLQDSSGRYIEKPSDFIEGPPLSPQEKGFVNRPGEASGAMQEGVLGLSKDFEVINGIIQAVPIDVMDNLIRAKPSSKELLHDEAMLKDLPPVSPYQAVRPRPTVKEPDVTSGLRPTHIIPPSEKITQIIPSESQKVKEKLAPKVKEPFDRDSAGDILVYQGRVEGQPIKSGHFTFSRKRAEGFAKAKTKEGKPIIDTYKAKDFPEGTWIPEGEEHPVSIEEYARLHQDLGYIEPEKVKPIAEPKAELPPPEPAPTPALEEKPKKVVVPTPKKEKARRERFEEAVPVEEKPTAIESLEAKPKKSVILEDKKKLLTDIDEAIKAAPEKPKTTKTLYEAVIKDKWHRDRARIIRESEEEARLAAEKQLGVDEHITILTTEVPAETVKFDIDGGVAIYNSKDALKEFKKRVEKTPEKTNLIIPTLKAKPFSLKRIAAKREVFDELVPIDKKGWFTDGHVLIKGEPPKTAKFAEGKPTASFAVVEDFFKSENQVPAELKYFYLIDPDAGTAVSKTPIPLAGIDVYNPPKVVFESSGKYAIFDQNYFNAVTNRYPNAEYRLNKEGSALIGYDKGKPVALIMSMRPDGEIVEGTLAFTKDAPLKKEAKEAGFLEEVKEGKTYEVTGKIEEPKEPYKVTEAAETALKDIPDFAKNISTAAGKMDRAPTGVKTLAVGINTEARKTGRIDLRGQKVKTAEDLAVLAQVYRDPRYETLRIFYIKNDVIVAHEGVTSRMPNFAMAFSKRPKFDIYKMKDRMKRLGADSYYLLHNHPSGDPTASQNDVGVTATYAREVSGFKAHIIINSGKYVVLGEGYYRLMSTMYGKERNLPGLPDDWKDPLLSGIAGIEKTEIRSPDDIAMLAQSLKTPENYVALIYRSGKAAVNAIQEMPINLFSNVKEASNYIRGRMREFGAGEVLAYFDSPGSIRKLFIAEPSPINQLIENGTLLDAVYSVSGVTISQQAEFGKVAKPGMVAGIKEEIFAGVRVAERDLKWIEDYFEKALKPKKIAVKKRIRLVTGQIKIGDLVREDIALKAGMRKAVQAARKAFSEGKKEGVEREKTRYRALAAKAKERATLRTAVNKMVKDLKAIDVEKMSPQEAEPIRDLLSGIDLVRMNKKTKLKLTRTREYFEDNLEVELPDYVLERVKRLDKQNLNDITFDELHSIYTAVMHYAHLNKLKNKIKVGRARREAREVLAVSIAEMKPPKKVETDIIASQPGGFKGIKKVGTLLKDTFGIRHDHYDLIIESLSGINSIMDKVLYQGVKEGITKQLKYKQDVYSRFNEDLGNFAEKYKIENIATWLEEEIRIGRFELTRGERMALYRHSLNTDNRRAIVEGGFGFRTSATPNKVHTMTEGELLEILESLTPAEKAFAGKSVENLFETQADELDKVFYEKNGYPMPREESYYPKEVMPLTRGKDIEKEEALERFKGKWTRIGLEKGMLEKRKRVRNPIYLNSISYDLNKSVMKSAAYVGLELPLSNASKLLYNRNFRRELTNRYGPQTWVEIEKGLRDIAGDWQSYTTTEELLLKTKNQLSVAFLGLNPFVMAKQVLSFSVYLPYIKPQYLMQGMLDYVSHPIELGERHKMYSPEYLERVEGGYSRDVADIFKKGAEKRLYAGKKSVKEKFMKGIKIFDSAAVTPGMQGAVLQVLDEFSQGTLSREVKIALNIEDSDIATLTAQDRMRLAYKFADYATERTQPMFSPEHRSSLSRGASVEKLGTMFGSFTNQALNLMRRSYREGKRTGDPAAYKKFAQSLFVVMVLNTLGVMMIDDIRDRLYGRKREGVISGILDTWSGYMFFVRDLASSVISKIERGTFLGYDVEWPIARVPELLSNTIANAVGVITEKGEKRKKKAARFIDDSLNLVLMMNGIPYQTPKRLAGVARELIQYGALPVSKRVASKEFVEEWVKIKRAGGSFTPLKKRVDAYNAHQKRKGKKGEPISWSTIAQKGINVQRAEVAAQKLRT